jgi:hypothetical protein
MRIFLGFLLTILTTRVCWRGGWGPPRSSEGFATVQNTAEDLSRLMCGRGNNAVPDRIDSMPQSVILAIDRRSGA